MKIKYVTISNEEVDAIYRCISVAMDYRDAFDEGLVDWDSGEDYETKRDWLSKHIGIALSAASTLSFENSLVYKSMYNQIQKWIIYHPEKQSFVTGKPFNYTTDPNLARIYSNYSDAILACHNHYDKEFGYGHYPIELRMHFNIDTLKKENND